ncbi:MAG TPA: ATP-binding protein [Acidimicrobiales bacterium]|nr:ATP-binding protein [Acidimicrobiales bacterium]
MRLALDIQAVTEARRFAREWAVAHAVPPPVVDDIELVVSELVTNAVRHGAPPIELDLVEDSGGAIRCEVYDASADVPRMKAAPDHLGGFGLRIVDSRTTSWGSSPVAEGKKVWFELNLLPYR